MAATYKESTTAVAAYRRSGCLPPQWLPTSAVASYLRSGCLPQQWLPTYAVAAYLRSGCLPPQWPPTYAVAAEDAQESTEFVDVPPVVGVAPGRVKVVL